MSKHLWPKNLTFDYNIYLFLLYFIKYFSILSTWHDSKVYVYAVDLLPYNSNPMSNLFAILKSEKKNL